ncbi:MAG: glycine zipper 2TM domain-containing protein [Proteobacteria bacterium]|nr:glycine zipper 2TM domain-containing protein [Desulfobacula sp.]MBU4130015.1 glycine zipper 2TM domain-containing protein [Pseudomonadota bacterium]
MKQLADSIKIIFFAGLTAVLIFGCASSRSSEVYSRDQAQKAQAVVAGIVESVKQITIEGTKTPVGTVAGGVAGGVLGSTIGGGSGRAVATVVGALAGAAAGTVAEEGLTKKAGLEIVVKQDNGQTIVVVQEADVMFAPGDRVRIISAPDGTTRVSK